MSETVRPQDFLIGQSIERLREVQGWSMRELARRMKDRGWQWTPTTASKVEKGERPIRLAEAPDLSELLETTIEGFLVDPLTRLLASIQREDQAKRKEQMEASRRVTQLAIERDVFEAIQRAHLGDEAVIVKGLQLIGLALGAVEWRELKEVFVLVGAVPAHVEELLAGVHHEAHDRVNRLGFNPETWDYAETLGAVSVTYLEHLLPNLSFVLDNEAQ